MAKRRNDAPWRKECLARRGAFCRACGQSGQLEIDHIVPRSQGGPSVVENGLVLCGSFTGNACHPKKTAGELKIRREWLDDDQIEWLAGIGWVRWDENGEVWGRGFRHFEEVA